MAQYARPISTVSSGSWSAQGDSTLHECVDETSQDGDTTHILADGVDTTCELGLTSVTDPASSTGHILRTWFRSIGGGGPERLVLHLYEGATLRASSGNLTNRSGSHAEGTYTLVEAEANAISDYGNLSIKVESSSLGGSDDMLVTQVGFEVPDAAGVTHYGAAALNGVGTIAGIGVLILTGLSTLVGTGTVACKGGLTTVGKATLVGIGTLTSLAQRITYGVATLAGTGTLASIGGVYKLGAATLSGAGTLVASGVRTLIGKTTLVGIGTLASIGQRITCGIATLAGIGTLSSLAGLLKTASVTLSGVGSLATVSQCIVNGLATLTGVGSLAASGVRVFIGKTTMAGVGALSAAGEIVIVGVYGAVTFSGIGALVAKATCTYHRILRIFSAEVAEARVINSVIKLGLGISGTAKREFNITSELVEK